MQNEIANEKDLIRRAVIKKRDGLPFDTIRDKSDQISKMLFDLPEYIEAGSILVYASMKSEVITDELIAYSLDIGKKVFCPKCIDTNNGLMDFIRIKDLSDLKSGFRGIREPEKNSESEIFKTSDEKALVIVPGVAFDKAGNRIGYKGGYYDRFLSGNPDISTIALAFLEQIVDEIPSENHDVPVQKVLYV